MENKKHKVLSEPKNKTFNISFDEIMKILDKKIDRKKKFE